MKHLIFISMTFLSTLSMAETPKIDMSVLGKTFEIPGPNCFSTALRVTGFYSTFRGVDEGEFTAIIKNHCQQVATPEPGDIGTYAFPKGGMFQHAYVYVDAEKGIEKAGVDYLGPSPVTENLLNNIDYIRFASLECRKYSGNNLSLCSNERAFYRCAKPAEATHPLLVAHNALILKIELKMMELIEGQVPKNKQMDAFSELEDLMDMKLAPQMLELSNLKLDPLELHYYSERQSSLRDQMIFINNRVYNPSKEALN